MVIYEFKILIRESFITVKFTDTPYIPQFFHPPENLRYRFDICNNFIDFDSLHILIVSTAAGILKMID